MVNKVAQRAIAAGLAGMMSFSAVAPAAMALDTHNWSSWWNWNDTSSDEGLTYWRRIAGDDRYGTMKKIVEASYKISGDYWWRASVAVVASGDNFPDALAANGLAGALNNGDGAPVILTKKGALSSQAKELLQKMSVQTVYIMGGTSAVSAETEQAIKDLKIATIRVAGADRQATSVEAFKLIDGNWYKNHGTHSVIIATGANYADALSIAPFAYRTGTPVVLTKADGTLTDEAIDAIKDNDQIYQLIVVGGTAAVSDSVFSVLGTYNGSYKDYYNKVYVPVRIAGADRYDTSAKVADWEINYAMDIASLDVNTKNTIWNTAGFSMFETFVATGENFPDALAGGQLAGGKYYSSATTVYVNGSSTKQARWDSGTYATASLKAGSPILLTKDGDRSADSVISKYLAWNWGTRSVDAYELLNGTFFDYLDDYLLGLISPDVYSFNADGFFTDQTIGQPETFVGSYTEYKTTTYDASDGVTYYIGATTYALGWSAPNSKRELYKGADASGKDVYWFFDKDGKKVTITEGKNTAGQTVYTEKYDDGTTYTYGTGTTGTAAFQKDVTVRAYAVGNDSNAALNLNAKNIYGGWIDGYRTVDSNFNGVILGGKAAVSKDVAKRLDDTVKDSIYKINDPVSSYWDSDSYITVGNKTYYTLGWLNKNTSSWWNNIGVQGYTAETAIAVPYGSYGYRYLYQPYDFKQEKVTYNENGTVKQQVYTIDFGRFDSQAGFAKVSDNSYTGYGLTGSATLKITYNYKTDGSYDNYTATWAEYNF